MRLLVNGTRMIGQKHCWKSVTKETLEKPWMMVASQSKGEHALGIGALIETVESLNELFIVEW